MVLQAKTLLLYLARQRQLWSFHHRYLWLRCLPLYPKSPSRSRDRAPRPHLLPGASASSTSGDESWLRHCSWCRRLRRHLASSAVVAGAGSAIDPATSGGAPVHAASGPNALSRRAAGVPPASTSPGSSSHSPQGDEAGVPAAGPHRRYLRDGDLSGTVFRPRGLVRSSLAPRDGRGVRGPPR